MHRLLTLGPRVGFALLVGVLVGFELLFVSEARLGAASLDAERTLREARAADTLDEALRGALEVAQARLEALETLPLVEEDGLLLVRGGVQRFPRLAGVAGEAPFSARDEAELQRALEVVWPDDAAARAGAMARLRRGEPVELPPGGWSPVFTEVLSRPPDGVVARLGLVRSLLERVSTEALDSARADRGPANSVLPEPVPFTSLLEDAQALVLRAWPWLSKQEASRACVQVQRRGDERGLKTERFAAACQRGLAAERVPVEAAPVEPRLVGAWLMVQREGEVRGVRVDLPAALADLQRTLFKRGLLEPGEALTAGEPSEHPLLRLELSSPRLTAAHAALRAALGWKSALLAMTGLLGLGVVLLARLAQRRKEETLAVQRDFIATVSHELRTPLAGIRLMAETLERKLGAQSAARDYPHRLVVAADGLGFLVENILSFNRLESGRWVPRREPFSFSSLEAVLRDDATLAVDATVEVQCEGLERMAVCQLDGQLIRVLALNLLRNAWKYGERQPVVVRVLGRDEGGVAVVSFSDNGPGISMGERERVFEAFHRSALTPTLSPSGRGRQGGSGLGLALARRIAGLHGGTLRISESSAAGTTFELRLPRG